MKGSIEQRGSHNTQVAILCGGRGSRLKPVTDSVPKPLVALNGRPILDYVMNFYRAKGFSHFTLCLGYKGDLIRAYYNRPPEGTEILFSEAGVDASMLQRLWSLRDTVEERLIVSYGDTFIDLDLEHMFATHLEFGAKATIVTAKIRNPFGLVQADSEGWVTSFVEKPILNYYIGSFIIERSAFDLITPDLLEKPDGQGLVDFFVSLAGKRQLAAFQHEGNQITFNTESERQKAEEDLGQYYTYSEDT